MSQIATINVRLERHLKDGGTAVLERAGVSPSELVRSAYRYMDKNQKIPPCLDVAVEEGDVVARKREALRTLVGLDVDGEGR